LAFLRTNCPQEISQKGEDWNMKLTRDKGTKKIHAVDDDDEIPTCPPKLERNSSSRPEYPARLLTCDLSELEEICRESKIDISQFPIEDQEVRKQKMLDALMATYPPEHERRFHRQIMRIVDAQNSGDDVMVNEEEVNELFEKLLTNFDVEGPIKCKLMKSFTIPEKIQHLVSSVWYSPLIISEFDHDLCPVCWMVIQISCKKMKT
jgi:hypothetical protein